THSRRSEKALADHAVDDGTASRETHTTASNPTPLWCRVKRVSATRTVVRIHIAGSIGARNANVLTDLVATAFAGAEFAKRIHLTERASGEGAASHGGVA